MGASSQGLCAFARTRVDWEGYRYVVFRGNGASIFALVFLENVKVIAVFEQGLMNFQVTTSLIFRQFSLHKSSFFFVRANVFVLSLVRAFFLTIFVKACTRAVR